MLTEAPGNYERKLGTLRTIDAVETIPGADRLELAVVDGWHVVVKKGDFKPSDQAIYFEVDSMLPVDRPEFAFLADRGVKERAGRPYHRLRTIRLRGVVSQGLLLPKPNLLEGTEPDDWTTFYEVVKYEPPVDPFGFRMGDSAGPFPEHLVPKSDSERAQNLSKVWSVLEQRAWVATEKIDGTSLTVARTLEGDLLVASRNLLRKEGDNVYWNAVRAFDLDQVLPGEAVQGEIFGPGVQGNPLKHGHLDFRAFAFWENRTEVVRAGWPEWAYELAVPIAPVEDFPLSVREAIEQADGLRSTINPDVEAEGIVWHLAVPAQPLKELGWRSTFKAINQAYLLAEA